MPDGVCTFFIRISFTAMLMQEIKNNNSILFVQYSLVIQDRSLRCSRSASVKYLSLLPNICVHQDIFTSNVA